MMDPLLVERALVMLQHCLRIRPKDNMLIVADRSADTLLVDALTAASVSLGAVPHTLEYAPGRYMFERDYCRFGGAWQLEL